MSPSGPPDLLRDWSVTPFWWTVLVLATTAYLIGVVRVARAGGRWPLARVGAWVAAAACLVVVLDSGVARFADHLFWVHMLVHLMLIMVIPALVVSAQPIRLSLTAATESGAAHIRAVVTHPVTRFVTSPVFSVPLYAAVLVLTHLTGFQQAMSEHAWIHQGETVLYLVSGYLLLLPMIGGEFSGHDLSHMLRFGTLLLAMGPDTLVGVVLMVSDYEVAPAYSASRAGWGPDGLADQTIAGAIMWFGGDGLMMLLLVLVAGQWIRAETRRDRSAPRRESWLERARMQATLGDGDAPSAHGDLDSDDAALAAYNARLAAMHGRTTPRPTSRDDDAPSR